MTRSYTRRGFLKVAGAASGAAAIVACAPQLTPAQPTAATNAPAVPVRGGIINIGTDRGGDVDYAGTGRQYARSVYNTLIRAESNGTYSPELAESWEMGADGKSYVFNLKRGIQFHDGSEFNAAAVKASWERIKDPALRSLFIADWTVVESFDVLAPYQFRLSLRQPDVTMLSRLSGKGAYVASPAALQKWGKEYGQHPVGTGPFQFSELLPDSKLTLKRWENYWEKDERGNQYPYLDGVVFKTLTDATSRFNALRGGELEYMDQMLPRDLDVLKQQPDLLHVEAVGSAKWFWMNGGKPPFNSKPLRQAIAWSLDRDAFHKAVFNSTGSPGRYMYGPWNSFFDASAPFYNFDPAKAAAALAAGGQPNGFKFTMHVANVTLDQQMAQVLKGQLAEQKVELNIETLQTQAIANTRRMAGDFEASLSEFSPYPDPSDTLYGYLRTGQPSNYVKYSNPRVDELLDKGKAEQNLQTRKQMYSEIQRLVIEDSPLVFLHHSAKLTGLHKSVQGYRPTVDTWLGFTERLWLKK